MADFALPAPDLPDQNVGIKIYLQNSGQSAALTPNLGLLPLNLVINGVGISQSTPPKFPLRANAFRPLSRTIDEHGGIQTNLSDPSAIAPQSEYVYYFPDQVSREQYDSMMRGQKALMLQGVCEYCDLLGQYSCREFNIFWQGPPFNAFSVAYEINCAGFHSAPPEVAGMKYLSPCEQPSERQEREEEEREGWPSGSNDLVYEVPTP